MRRAILRVEELGQRLLPSASPLDFHQTALTALHAPPHHNPHSNQDLHGSGVAVYTTTMQIPDTGTTYQLQGFGSFGVVGPASVTGDLHSVGFILQGHATGTLTLTNARGSVTLDLTGPAQPGFSALPQQFQFEVVSTTGAYGSLLHDQGTLQLHTIATNAATPGFGVFSIQI